MERHTLCSSFWLRAFTNLSTVDGMAHTGSYHASHTSSIAFDALVPRF
jgi:hypothetical protein